MHAHSMQPVATCLCIEICTSIHRAQVKEMFISAVLPIMFLYRLPHGQYGMVTVDMSLICHKMLTPLLSATATDEAIL